MRLTPALSCACLAALAPLAAGQSAVHVVDDDGGPGVDFTSLQAALTAAADGDVLLVRSGTYVPIPVFEPEHELDGKGLVVVADGDVTIGAIDVRNLGPGQHVAVRGVAVQRETWDLTDDAGPVWLEDVRFVPPATGGLGLGTGVVATSCAAVALIDCELAGIDALPGPSAPAVRAVDSFLHVYGGTFEGGAADQTHSTFPASPGLETVGGFAFASGAAFLPGLLGTVGAHQSGAAAASVVLDVAGTFVVSEGTQTVLPGAARSYDATAVVREGESVTLTWTGTPGELAILNLAPKPGGLYFPQFHGSAVLGLAGLYVQGMGTIPASGTLSVDIPIPQLGDGVEGIVLFTQGSFADLGTGAIRVGGGSLVLVLDAAL